MEYNSHYVFNPYLLNPSMIGDGEKNIFLGYRKQWAGFLGAPEIQQITFDSPLENKKSAIGFRVSNDITNVIGRTSGYLTYKYKVRFSKESDLSFALSGGFFSN
jgi:type IX secretion system PorP/SprF family membrane protein